MEHIKEELISIVIPTYNREKLIKNSIESLLQQTYSNIEIIVVDDCSSDNTEKVVKSIKDKRIRYYKLQQNGGACKARNVGVLKSKGQIITFQDSDDLYKPDKIEKQYENMMKNKSDIDFCQVIINDGVQDVLVPSKERTLKLKKNKDYINELSYGNYITTTTIMAKKEVLQDEKFDEVLPRLQDYDLVLRIVSKYVISFTPIPLVRAYVQKDSIGNSNEKLRRAVEIMLSKDYSLSYEQHNKLVNYLLEAHKHVIETERNKVINAKDEELQKRQNEINKLTNDIKELNDGISFLQNQIKAKDSEIEQLSNQYNKIVNSKRYKTINKILKIFGK